MGLAIASERVMPKSSKPHASEAGDQGRMFVSISPENVAPDAKCAQFVSETLTNAAVRGP